MRDRTAEQQVLSPIPPDKQESRGWTLTLNGEVVPIVTSLELRNHRFGVLRYGSMDGKYDTWCHHENGGGDAVTIPYAKIQGELFVGVLEEMRPLRGGPVLNIPRGFLGPRETAKEGAVREVAEEMGFETPDRFMELNGEPANSNSAFLNTALSGEGDHFFALRIEENELEPLNKLELYEEELEYPRFRFKKETKPRTDEGEKIIRSIFIPWKEAARIGDMYTNAAVARLLAHLTP